jgi:hypothetical protein
MTSVESRRYKLAGDSPDRDVRFLKQFRLMAPWAVPVSLPRVPLVLLVQNEDLYYCAAMLFSPTSTCKTTREGPVNSVSSPLPPCRASGSFLTDFCVICSASLPLEFDECRLY